MKELEKMPQNPSDNKLDYGIFREYPGWEMDTKEGRILYGIIKYFEPKIVLELGTYRGISGAYILLALKQYGGMLYSVDRTESHIKDAEINLSTIGGDYKLFCCSTEDLEWNDSIDLLFVDAGHEYSECKNDLNKFSPYVKKGGIILVHDYILLKKTVTVAVDEFLVKHNGEYKTLILSHFHNGLIVCQKMI